MNWELTEEILEYIDSRQDEAIELIEAICKIPAPSHHEEKRAEYCKKWFESIGAEGVYIDSAKKRCISVKL